MNDWAGVVGLAVAICALIAYIWRGHAFLNSVGARLLQSRLVVVVRSEQLEEFEDRLEYVAKLSIVNRSEEPITVNSVVLHVGDYVGESHNPLLAYLLIRRFPRQVAVDYVGHPDGKAYPLLEEHKSQESMGSATFVLLADRGLLGPHDQCDIDLGVRLYRPRELKSKYPTIWSLGGTIEIDYEDRSLTQRKLQFPRRGHRRGEGLAEWPPDSSPRSE